MLTLGTPQFTYTTLHESLNKHSGLGKDSVLGEIVFKKKYSYRYRHMWRKHSYLCLGRLGKASQGKVTF